MQSDMIAIDHVFMRFRLSDDRILSLKEFVTRKLSGKLSYSEFWALRDVSFTVKRGEVLGIIGHNGAGKSTLLKVISGILKPTKGTVTCNGNIVPMLELGSGFDTDLTGRENIFLNGAVLGYSEEFLNTKFDEIVAFSELGQFIDVPIRNYSSGMLMRLAFSVATVVNPEILIVDEILAVGDENFQQKSRARMRELMSGGTTVLFVSHSLSQIREMCDRVAWLEHGQVQMIGPANEVCDAYNR
ncbi:MAG TPA: ABC transporter ATP-binding protein [Clostridia bacterium]|nr:ABC transporter ATP-binding protein [Clostridia bacterium]